MDKAIYIDTSGAKNTMQQLRVLTNNLANVDTTGFREDHEKMMQYQVNNKSNQTRTYAALESTYTDFSPGSILNTGRDLDAAISGKGFFAVQSKTGEEAYTRAGDFQLSSDGFLTTKSGDLVVGTSGAINITQAERVIIGTDGTVSAILKGQTTPVVVNRLKLVDPPLDQLQKGQDGLFHLPEGAGAPLNESITLVSGALEGSNVNPVDALTKLIDLSRQFEMHTNLMKTVEQNASKANQLLDVGH